MQFDGWTRNCLDHIVERDARKTEAGRIDDRAVNIVDVRLKGIDQHAFVIRLLDDHLDAKFSGKGSNLVIDEFECRQSVDVRLTAPEKIGVRAVQNEKSKPAGTIGRSFTSGHMSTCY